MGFAEQIEELEEKIDDLKSQIGDKENDIFNLKWDIKKLYDFLIKQGYGWIEVSTVLEKMKELELC